MLKKKDCVTLSSTGDFTNADPPPHMEIIAYGLLRNIKKKIDM